MAVYRIEELNEIVQNHSEKGKIITEWLENTKSISKNTSIAIIEILKKKAKSNNTLPISSIISFDIHSTFDNISWEDYIEYINANLNITSDNKDILYGQYEYYAILVGKIMREVKEQFNGNPTIPLVLEWSFMDDDFTYVLDCSTQYSKSISVKIHLDRMKYLDGSAK